MRRNEARRVLAGAAATVACVMVASSAAFACTYYKGKLEATGFNPNGSVLGKKTVWGLGGANQMMYCPPKVKPNGTLHENSDPNTPVVTDNAVVRLAVSPHDCNGDGVQEWLNDGQPTNGPGPTPYKDPDGKFDVNYRHVVGNFYGDPNLNDCMTPYDGTNVGTLVTVNAGVMPVANGFGGPYNLTLPGTGDFTVCVSSEAPNPPAEQFQYDAIQTSVRSI